MSYRRYHAIIVTSWDSKKLLAARNIALSIFPASQVSYLVDAAINQAHTFFIGPDGSNEGWEPSQEGDRQRDKFIIWLDEQAYEDGSNALTWLEIQYGDEEGDDKITRSYAQRRASHQE